MIRRPPSPTRTDTRFPDPTLFRSPPKMAGRRLHLQFIQRGGQLHDPLVRHGARRAHGMPDALAPHRSEEHTSELQSLMRISYAVFCLKKKKNKTKQITLNQHTDACIATQI